MSKSDMMTSYVRHCFCTYCTKMLQVFITFQHYHVTQRLVGHNSVGSKTKSIRPRLRPRPKLQHQDQDPDRGWSETSLVIRPQSQTPRLVPADVSSKWNVIYSA